MNVRAVMGCVALVLLIVGVVMDRTRFSSTEYSSEQREVTTFTDEGIRISEIDMLDWSKGERVILTEQADGDSIIHSSRTLEALEQETHSMSSKDIVNIGCKVIAVVGILILLVATLKGIHTPIVIYLLLTILLLEVVTATVLVSGNTLYTYDVTGSRELIHPYMEERLSAQGYNLPEAPEDIVVIKAVASGSDLKVSYTSEMPEKSLSLVSDITPASYVFTGALLLVIALMLMDSIGKRWYG